MPYWTTDIGGFFRPGRSQYTDEKFHELLTRWFQWGAFNPIFRIHGYQSETEPWKYSQQVEDNMRKILNLRYRLLPYIYSEAWQVTRNGATMMRPLVMDFRTDVTAIDQFFEYMFGKSILVALITEPGINEWDVYLPKSSNWYDFRTSKSYNGGQTVKTKAPLDEIPLFVKAGSIIPMGPIIQYATEKNDPIEIRIYPGADAEFTLCEDENDNYNYEKGLYSTIEFKWNDAKNVLTIDKHRGAFPGTLEKRQFNIVRVAKDKGSGMDTITTIDKTVNYKGKKITVKL
jgi:alpha-D-xyloside xylohydrolase